MAIPQGQGQGQGQGTPQRTITIPNWVIAIWSFARWIIGAFIIGAIGWFVRGQLDKTNAPTQKYIALVMSENDQSFSIPKEFNDGFFSTNSTKVKSSSNESIFIDTPDDYGDEEATNRLAKQLVQDENCVLIIGNSNSHLTKVTLDKIIEVDNNRPSLLMPIATADDILKKAAEAEYRSILRMVPDNDNQADIIKRFIFQKYGEKANVAILEDEDNKTYSANLASNLATKIRTDKGNVVHNQQYGSSSRLSAEFQNLTNANKQPDVFVFVGISPNGLNVIDELKTFDNTTPIIFTDGCTVEALINSTKTLQNNCYFLSAVEKQKNGFEPTYEPIGKDAFDLTKQIVEGIEGPITRKKVSEFIATNKSDIFIRTGHAGSYEFSADGNNNKMNFKIYHFVENDLVEYQGIK